MSQKNSVPVWDLVVRIFHWSLVLTFVVAYATSEGGGEVHEISGYLVLALICVRVVWGFVGTEYARFRQFIFAPQQVLDYVRSLRAGNPKHYLGHNPLGGWMVIALLMMLFVVTLSGLKLEDIKEDKEAVTAISTTTLASTTTSTNNLATLTGGDTDGDKDNNKDSDSDQEKFWEEFHESATNIMLVLIALHILGVIISSRQHQENLVKAMLTGKKER